MFTFGKHSMKIFLPIQFKQNNLNPWVVCLRIVCLCVRGVEKEPMIPFTHRRIGKRRNRKREHEGIRRDFIDAVILSRFLKEAALIAFHAAFRFFVCQ